MNLKKSVFLLFVLLSVLGNIEAQNSSLDSNSSAVKIETLHADTSSGMVTDSSLMKIHSPKKAALFSAIIPGAGQVYNKKYWKVPLIYGAGIGLVYIFRTNYKEYNKLRESYITRVDSTSDGTDHFPTISTAGLKSESERTQKNYELAAIGVALVYALQIVDATVDAHLKTFDVSDDLSLAIRPTVIGNPYKMAQGIPPTLGLKLNLRFK